MLAVGLMFAENYSLFLQQLEPSFQLQILCAPCRYGYSCSIFCSKRWRKLSVLGTQFLVWSDWQVLNQDQTPLLYSIVFGEGVVNDATSVVLFKAIQKFDLSDINSNIILKFIGSFLFLFVASTLLGVMVSFHLIHPS